MTETAEAQMLQNLLAVIHRDGGHHVGNVGLAQATKDAISKVYAEREWTGRILYPLKKLVEAKKEKEANGESNLYLSMKVDAWAKAKTVYEESLLYQ